jgi:dipeptide/tripeptide permease
VGSSLNVFAANRTDRVLGGWRAGLVPGGEIPAAWFQAINPFFVLLRWDLFSSASHTW